MVEKKKEGTKTPATQTTAAGQLKKFQEETINAVLMQVKSLDERTLDHLAGYRGSQPVRIKK